MVFITIATAFIGFPYIITKLIHIRPMAEPEIVSGSIFYVRFEVLTEVNMKIWSLGHLRCDTMKFGSL
jgi:hypothetical protein